MKVYFESTVEIPRVKVGKRQIVSTLIKEEALLFAESLRVNRTILIPRFVQV